ncbi:MAG: CooT family nickel-binding protein [Bacillota bacterium]|nr:CooT family nickel-binding protein [Bacillota bacterium]
MCLAKVYLGDAYNGDPVADSVTALDSSANEVTVRTLFGDTKTFEGTIKSIDFTESVITIETA